MNNRPNATASAKLSATAAAAASGEKAPAPMIGPGKRARNSAAAFGAALFVSPVLDASLERGYADPQSFTW
jgi:hypothetical protein